MLMIDARRAGRYFNIQQLMPRCFAVVACYLLHFAKVPDVRNAGSPESRASLVVWSSAPASAFPLVIGETVS
jgi:hypothetical protein